MATAAASSYPTLSRRLGLRLTVRARAAAADIAHNPARSLFICPRDHAAALYYPAGSSHYILVCFYFRLGGENKRALPRPGSFKHGAASVKIKKGAHYLATILSGGAMFSSLAEILV